MRMQKKSHGSRAAALTLLIVIAAVAGNASAQYATPTPVGSPSTTQVPQPEQGGVNWTGAGYGAGALVSNVVYIPAKFVYALLGGVVGGAGYVLTGGNSQTSDTIWRSALGGDYVVTPEMLSGQQELHFSGPTETAPEVPTVKPISGASAPPSQSLSLGTSTSAGSSSGTAPSGGESAKPSPTAPPMHIE